MSSLSSDSPNMNYKYHQNYAQKIVKKDGVPVKTLMQDNLTHKMRFLKSMTNTFNKYSINLQA